MGSLIILSHFEFLNENRHHFTTPSLNLSIYTESGKRHLTGSKYENSLIICCFELGLVQISKNTSSSKGLVQALRNTSFKNLYYKLCELIPTYPRKIAQRLADLRSKYPVRQLELLHGRQNKAAISVFYRFLEAQHPVLSDRSVLKGIEEKHCANCQHKFDEEVGADKYNKDHKLNQQQDNNHLHAPDKSDQERTCKDIEDVVSEHTTFIQPKTSRGKLVTPLSNPHPNTKSQLSPHFSELGSRFVNNEQVIDWLNGIQPGLFFPNTDTKKQPSVYRDTPSLQATRDLPPTHHINPDTLRLCDFYSKSKPFKPFEFSDTILQPPFAYYHKSNLLHSLKSRNLRRNGPVDSIKPNEGDNDLVPGVRRDRFRYPSICSSPPGGGSNGVELGVRRDGFRYPSICSSPPCVADTHSKKRKR